MLRIYNKTDSALSIMNYELPERSSIDVDIPYTDNLRFMERQRIIAVIDLSNRKISKILDDVPVAKKSRKSK